MNHSEQIYSSREPLYPNYWPNNTPIRQKKKKETNYIKQNCIYLLSPEKIQIFVSQEIMIYKSSKKNKLGQWRKRLPSDVTLYWTFRLFFQSTIYTVADLMDGGVLRLFGCFHLKSPPKKMREREYSCCRSCYRSIFLISAMITWLMFNGPVGCSTY